MFENIRYFSKPETGDDDSVAAFKIIGCSWRRPDSGEDAKESNFDVNMKGSGLSGLGKEYVVVAAAVLYRRCGGPGEADRDDAIEYEVCG